MRVITGIALLAAVLAAQPKRPRILGVASMALWVSDLDKARGFYKDFLGFAEPRSGLIQINDHQYVELHAGLKPEQDRLHHIALYTDDVAALRAYLAARGVSVPERVVTGRFSVRDPQGRAVEFIQYARAPGSTLPEAQSGPSS